MPLSQGLQQQMDDIARIVRRFHPLHASSVNTVFEESSQESQHPATSILAGIASRIPATLVLHFRNGDPTRRAGWWLYNIFESKLRVPLSDRQPR